MAYNLVCVHPFGNYSKGQLVDNQDEVNSLSDDREHHFVRVAAPEEAKDEPKAPEAKKIDAQKPASN
jgi:hypothetical protein